MIRLTQTNTAEMKKSFLVTIAFGIFFLFLIQMAGTLVESIYILDLMNKSLDEKALGLLFLFSPVLLFFYRKKLPVQAVLILFGLLLLARGLTPYLNTLERMIASGIGTGAALMLFPFLVTARVKDDSIPGFWISAGLALAVGFSVFLRTMYYGLDFSLIPEGAWVGWGLGIALACLVTVLDRECLDKEKSNSRPVTLAVTGIFLVLALAWFVFSAPSVIVRWTEGNYTSIVMTVSLMSLIWAGLSFNKLRWIENISSSLLLIWNLLFTLSLILTILAHRIVLPQTPDSPAIVVGTPTLFQQLPLVVLLLFPVIFLDLRVFSNQIRKANPGPRDLIPGMLLGSFSLIVLIFMQIFTNVWSRVDPVSPWFRNKFWLPYLLMAGLITLLVGRKGEHSLDNPPEPHGAFSLGWWAFLVIVFLGTASSALITTRVKTIEPQNASILVMTYNIQQANDIFGERSFKQQLELIRQIDPDILALQESSSNRISLNNNDFVRYYAGQLGYYSYYGPRTITGTYGTAILSKYPLQNTRTVYTYSDQDEIGTAEAEIKINGEIFTVYSVHPDGSDTAMGVWAKSLLERSQDKLNVIILGDFNLRDYEEAYKLIAREYKNAWVSVNPSPNGSDGADMSGENRIDHIFLSQSLIVCNTAYILPPESATDHPVHWAEIIWKK